MGYKYKGQLVCQHLEGISSAVFEKYQSIIKDFIKGRHGVYALYRHNHLYYVGLATDMKIRLPIHLKDKHANKWDSFSIYLTLGDQHLKELESLVLRVAMPEGNDQGGRFIRSENLIRKFKNEIKDYQKKELSGLIGKSPKAVKQKEEDAIDLKSKYHLSRYFKKRTHIRYRYKGKLYIAHIRTDGKITFASESADWKRLKNRTFNSPSAAASAITKHAMDGWRHWKYERSPGEWVLIDVLR